MKRTLYILMLLPLIVAVTVQAQTAKQYFKTGEDFTKANNYQDAIAQFTRAIELDPDYEKAYVSRAIAYSRTGEHKSAAEDYDRALVFDDKDEELYYFSGKEWHQHGNIQFALIKLTTAINMKKNFLEAYQIRQAVYMEMEQYEQALKDCEMCLKLNNDEQSYYNLAQV